MRVTSALSSSATCSAASRFGSSACDAAVSTVFLSGRVTVLAIVEDAGSMSSSSLSFASI